MTAKKWKPKTSRAQGERSGNAKLVKEDVIHIRNSPLPASTLCRQYQMSAEQIRKIKRGEAWAWVTEGLDDQELIAQAQIAELQEHRTGIVPGSPEAEALADLGEGKVLDAETAARIMAAAGRTAPPLEKRGLSAEDVDMDKIAREQLERDKARGE